MRQAASLLPGISAERQRDELFKILRGPRPDAALRALEILGVLPYLLPELPALKGVRQPAPHVHDVWDHTLSVMHHLEGILAALDVDPTAVREDGLITGLLTGRLGRYREQLAAHFLRSMNPDRSVRSLLFFAALYHDVAKPTARTEDFDGRIRFLGHEQLGADVTRAGAGNSSSAMTRSATSGPSWRTTCGSRSWRSGWRPGAKFLPGRQSTASFATPDRPAWN